MTHPNVPLHVEFESEFQNSHCFAMPIGLGRKIGPNCHAAQVVDKEI